MAAVLPSSVTGHVLALDLASTAGWAAGAFGTPPRCGSVFLRGAAPVEQWASLRQWLDDYEGVSGRVTALVLEASILTPRDTPALIEILWGLRATALMWAYDGEIIATTYPAQSVRAHMLGTARFGKGQVKPAVMDWCRARGFDPRDDNAGDALLTWHYAEALAHGTRRAPKPGLFAA